MGRDWNSLLNPPKFDVPILKIETYPIRRTIQPGLLALLGVLLSACGDKGKSKPEVVAVESSNVAKVPTRPAESPFVHPGLLSTKADLERMAAKVAAAEEPWKGSWDILVRNTDGFLRNHPEGAGGQDRRLLARPNHRELLRLSLRVVGHRRARPPQSRQILHPPQQRQPQNQQRLALQHWWLIFG